MDRREITFKIDKYKKPVLLSTKESIARIIINALLMVPGNLPGNPLVGVNIMQYIYRKVDDVNTSQIMENLQFAIGDTLGDTVLDDVSVASVRYPEGDILVVNVRLRMPDAREDDTLVVLLKKTDDRVHFNYKCMSEVLQIIS